MDAPSLINLAQPTGLQVIDWGERIAIKCALTPYGETTLTIPGRFAMEFAMVLIQAAGAAVDLRSQRRTQNADPSIEEPPTVWPVESVTTALLQQSRGVGLLVQFPKGAPLPLHLSAKSSRQLAQELLQHADALDALPPVN